MQPITPWMPDDTAEFQSNSSVGSDSSPISQLGDRTASTGLAEATMLGSSPDEVSQPVFTARQASGAFSSFGVSRSSPEGKVLLRSFALAKQNPGVMLAWMWCEIRTDFLLHCYVFTIASIYLVDI